MQGCSSPSYSRGMGTIDSAISSSSRSSVFTSSLDDKRGLEKSDDCMDERWMVGPGWRKDGPWESLRAPPPARLSLSSHKQPLSPLSTHSPAAFSPFTMSRLMKGLRSLPASPGTFSNRSIGDNRVFSPTTTVPMEVEASMEYLADLVKEKKHLALFPHMFNHVDRLLDDEISRVRVILFQTDFIASDMNLPEPAGDIVSITEKIYVPKKEYPDYNFVGRILGPRGMTAKQLEQETGCKIMVRGKGSMRDKKKEDSNRGKTNWEHLEDDLHVLVQCEDTENRVHTKIRAAVEQVKKLLVPAPEGTDELKRKQLMELAIINGTFRPMKSPNPTRVMTAVPLLSPMRGPGPLILSPSPSPTPGGGSISGHTTILHSPTLPPNSGSTMVNSNTPAFDYSSLLNLDSALNALQLTPSDIHISKYPTTTSFVNTFPSLFSSPISQGASSKTESPVHNNSASSQSSF